MVSSPELASGQEYRCQRVINLYKTPACDSLVTQAAIARPLHVQHPSTPPGAYVVRLCDDDYPGWIRACDALHLVPAETPYRPVRLTGAAIAARIPAVLAFARAAMTQPHQYRWGGTVGPDYDCSGLVQAAFAAAGIIVPRDAYQQEAFATPVEQPDLRPGDLLFFGSRERTTHVALYLGDGQYIHSSGREQGRNGIGIDSLTQLEDSISRTYAQQLQGAGRVTHSYQATGRPMLRR